MHDHAPEQPVLEAAAAEPVTPGRPVLAWAVILALAALVIWSQGERPASVQDQLGRALASRSLLFQARVLVAARNILGRAEAGVDDQIAALSACTVKDRLRVAILGGELQGPNRAQELVAGLQDQLGRATLRGALVGPASKILEPSRLRMRHETLAGILWRLYEHYKCENWAAPSVDAEERERLVAELGWFGELALAPREGPDSKARAEVLRPAYLALFSFAAVLSLAILVGLAGFIGLVVFLVLLLAGKVVPGLGSPSGYGGIYAETFAVWLLLFSAISLGLGRLPLPRLPFVFSTTGFLLSLAALAWPVLRGVPWQQVRADIGLTAGRKPFLEPFAGLGAYAMGVPLAALGLLITMLLMSSSLGSDARPPTHPVVDAAPEMGWWGRALMFILACVAAPLVEETMFRGVLYRHLRDATGCLGQAGSFLVGALAVSFIFAVVHPQGLLGVPPLMGLAFAFTLAREWRGSLVAAMVAHGTNNCVMLGMLFLFVD